MDNVLDSSFIKPCLLPDYHYFSRHDNFEIVKQTIEIHYERLNWEDLVAEEQELLTEAMEAAKLAYAPYSQFHVGCAVRLADGSIHLGNNQENRAYPSGLCAERTVFFHLGAIGKGKEVRKVAIRAYGERVHLSQPVTPCGSCRQVMLEYEEMAQTDFVVLMMGESGDILRTTGIKKTLMPFSFEADF